MVRVIDLGRAALRPAMSDLVRLAAQDFRRRPELEEAFLAGYGVRPAPSRRSGGATSSGRPSGPPSGPNEVGAIDFEAQGHRMIADALADPS